MSPGTPPDTRESLIRDPGIAQGAMPQDAPEKPPGGLLPYRQRSGWQPGGEAGCRRKARREALVRQWLALFSAGTKLFEKDFLKKL